MKHLKKYNEGFMDKFYKFIAKGKLDRSKPSEKKLPDFTFGEDEILDIKDMFLDMSDKYNVEEDENGKLMQYIDLHGTNRKGRHNPQFFIEKEMDGKLLIFSIASSSSFMTDDFRNDLQEFKDRLDRAGYKCDKDDVLNRIWIKYVSFYISKNPDKYDGPADNLMRNRKNRSRLTMLRKNDRTIDRVNNRIDRRNANNLD